MKKLLQQICMIAGVIIATGCSTVDMNNANKPSATYQATSYTAEDKSNLENLRYLTKATPARIQIQVIGDTKVELVTRAVEGAIANAGYEVIADSQHTGQNDNPYLTVSLRNTLKEPDKLGNYYVCKGKTELSVKRNIKTASARKTLLAREVITAKGSRKLGLDDARDSIAEELGLQSAKYIKEVCNREMGGITAANLNIQKRMVRTMFDAKPGNEEVIVSQILKKVAAIDGILSVHQTSVSKDKITAQLIYRKKNFPNGVVREYIDGNFKLKSSNKIEEFVKQLVK